MDKYLEEKVAKLRKSLYKNIQKASKKDVIDDVLDSNNVAEISPDSISPDKASVVKKSKHKDDEEDCGCEDCNNCKCDEAPLEKPGIHKTEAIARKLLKGFELVSTMYFLKKDEEQATKVWNDMLDQSKAFKEQNPDYGKETTKPSQSAPQAKAPEQTSTMDKLNTISGKKMPAENTQPQTVPQQSGQMSDRVKAVNAKVAKMKEVRRNLELKNRKRAEIAQKRQQGMKKLTASEDTKQDKLS